VVAKDIVALISEKQICWKEGTNLLEGITPEAAEEGLPIISGHVRNLVRKMEDVREQIASTGQMGITQAFPDIASSQICSESRDNLFGLLGCADTSLPPGFVDYCKSVREVFRDATILLIQTYESSNIIVYGHLDGRIQQKGLPGWCPYWGNNHHLSVTSYFDAHAASNRTQISSMANLPDKLRVRGRLIDSISVVLAGNPHMSSLDYIESATKSNVWLPIHDLCYQVWSCSRDEKNNPSGSGPQEESPLNIVREVVDTVCCHDFPSQSPFKLAGL
jgi:hypothetical protein